MQPNTAGSSRPAPSPVSSPLGGDPRLAIGNDTKAMILYDANKKSTFVAYVLWFFFGGLGVHRFYAGRPGSGAAMLVITLLSLILGLLTGGLLLVFLLIPLIWALVDLFLIPGMIQSQNNLLAHSLISRS